MERALYSYAFRSVMYLMVCSRPDLPYSVSVLRRYMSKSGDVHFETMEWLLRYIKGTSDLGIQFKRQFEGIIMYRWVSIRWEAFMRLLFVGFQD